MLLQVSPEAEDDGEEAVAAQGSRAASPRDGVHLVLLNVALLLCLGVTINDLSLADRGKLLGP